MSQELEKCIGCGMLTERVVGESHSYMLSSPKCWSLYGELLAREYSNSEYMSIHALTVDAYALQHPGIENAKAISSIYVHLTSLYAYFALGVAVELLPKVKQTATVYSKKSRWLEPPANTYTTTVFNVLEAKNAQEHQLLVEKWTKETYNQWSSHHALIAKLYKQYISNC